ncbi:hypothetical protein [Pigmentiphaga soli]|uniref:hypothetical protein n=1 Tax=Pigmentiphaga soli TaxID=1007095 RepID=UPI0031EB5AD5
MPGRSPVGKWLSMAAAACVLAALGACGGDDDGGGSSSPPPGSPPAAVAAKLDVDTYARDQNGATAVYDNGKGGEVAVWTDPSTDMITQATYADGSGAKARAFFGPAGEIQRVVDEASGAFLTVTPVNNDRTDYNLYDQNGAWQSGWAVTKSASDYAAARILGSSAVAGEQMSGDLVGPLTASFSLITAGNSGLDGAVPLPSAPLMLDGTATVTLRAGVFERMLAMIVPAAHAQSAPSAVSQLAGNALIGFMGGAALSGGQGDAGARLMAAALVGLGAYQVWQGLAGTDPDSLGSLSDAAERLLGAALDAMRNGDVAVATLLADMANVLQNGAGGLPALTDLLDNLNRTINQAVSALVRLPADSWTAITAPPPAVATSLNGLMVDNSGTSYTMTGTYQPGDRSLSFTGVAGSTTVNGSTTVDGNDQFSGNYTVMAGGNSNSGSFSGGVRALGACQTQQASGGQGTFSKVYALGKESGTFDVSYDMYSIPDGMDIRAVDGTLIFTTNGLVSGVSSQAVDYAGGQFVFVTLYAPNSGTAWDYSIGCPQ